MTDAVADELRTAGLTVLDARARGRGRCDDVEAIEVELTHTGADREGADDVNGLGLVDSAVAYVERDGRVWLFAEGPTRGRVARIVLAAYRDPTDEQDDAVAVLKAVLGDRYGVSGDDPAPDAGDQAGGADPGTSDDNSGDD